MPLVRWEPFREIDSLQREMNRLFSQVSSSPDGEMTGAFVPPAEIYETPEAVHLKLELPGLDPKNLDVQVTADAVSISGDRQSETKAEGQGVMRTEFRYGSFRRVIPLPARIQNTNVQADYKDGILTLTLPKAEEEKNKVVKVQLS